MKPRRPGARTVDAAALVATPALGCIAEEISDITARGYQLMPNARVFSRNGGSTVRLVLRRRAGHSSITLVVRL